MESELYALLNNLLTPKRFPVILSLAILLSVPVIMEMHLIIYLLNGHYGSQIILTLESLSVLIGYIYIFLLIKIRIRIALNCYKEKRIYCLIGSFPAILYLLSPGLISLILGIILQHPLIATYIGRKMIRISHIDPSIVYTLLELNNAK